MSKDEQISHLLNMVTDLSNKIDNIVKIQEFVINEVFMNKGSSQNQTMLNLLKSVTLNQNNMKKQSSQVPP